MNGVGCSLFYHEPCELRAVGAMAVNLDGDAESLARIDQPATALNLETGRRAAPGEFLAGLLEHFFAEYPVFLARGFRMIHAEYLRRCRHLGREIEFRLPGGMTIPVIALLLCLWLLAQAQLDAWLTLGAFFVLGSGLYYWARRRG